MEFLIESLTTRMGENQNTQSAKAVKGLDAIEGRIASGELADCDTDAAVTAIAILVGGAMALVLQELTKTHPHTMNYMLGTGKSNSIWNIARVVAGKALQELSQE